MTAAPYFFQFHIGDYLRDAQELSLMQHGAYQQLMLWYYSTGRPIPNDLDRIYRRVGAMSREEKHAVEYVLGEFFKLSDNTWRHARIDAELKKYSKKIEKAKESANARWALENLNKNNGTRYANAHATAMRTQCVGNANQEPITNKDSGNYYQGAENGRSVARHQSSKPGPDGPKTQNPNNPARPGESWEQYTTRLRHESRKVREG